MLALGHRVLKKTGGGVQGATKSRRLWQRVSLHALPTASLDHAAIAHKRGHW